MPEIKIEWDFDISIPVREQTIFYVYESCFANKYALLPAHSFAIKNWGNGPSYP